MGTANSLIPISDLWLGIIYITLVFVFIFMVTGNKNRNAGQPLVVILGLAAVSIIALVKIAIT